MFDGLEFAVIVRAVARRDDAPSAGNRARRRDVLAGSGQARLPALRFGAWGTWR